METTLHRIVEVISETIDPFDLIVKIRHGENVSSIAAEISKNLGKFEHARSECEEMKSLNTIMWILTLAYTGKGYRYIPGTKKCDGLDEIYSAIVRTVSLNVEHEA